MLSNSNCSESYPKDYPNDPKHLWDAFYELTRVPRPSKKEGPVREYLKNEAKKNALRFVEDSVGNIIIYVPGKGGLENRPPVMLQSHMDMVCDKTPERVIDFEKDPIEIFVKEGRIYAQGTTLGADNGFGIAASIALLREKDIAHPPLELLFTVDEETGLHGARNLEKNLFKSRRGINIDTEEWGSTYIGCAGGIDYEFFGSCREVKAPLEYEVCRLVVSRLKGGHSGIDIHRSRGNALKILTEVLWSARHLSYELSAFKGGKAHNIIPRDSEALILVDKKQVSDLKKICEAKVSELKKYLPLDDHALAIEIISQNDRPALVVDRSDRDRLLSLLTLFPHGAYSYNWHSEEPLVNYSSNLAQVKIEAGKLFIETSVRYLDPSETISIDQKFESLAHLFTLELKKGAGYPSWKPSFTNNELVDLASNVFKDLFHSTLKVKAIHAGLECGIIKDKLQDMQMISLGPDITGAHSPTESLDIETSKKFWKFFTTLLSRM